MSETVSPNPTSSENNTNKLSNPKVLLTIIIGSFVAFITIVIVFALFMFSDNSPLRDLDNSRPTSSITVTGTAKQKVKPDTAIATFIYTQKGSDSKKLNEDADKTITKISEYLQKNGISNENIVSNKSSYTSYYPIPGDPRGSTEELTTDVTYEVTFDEIDKDPAKPNTILNGLVDLGVNRYYGFRYLFKNNESICKELEIKAIENGYTQAQRSIDALGKNKIISREVTESVGGCGGFDVYPIYSKEVGVSTSPDSLTDSIPPQLDAGEQELTHSVKVKVTYR